MNDKIKNSLILLITTLIIVFSVLIFDKTLNKEMNNSLEKENLNLKKQVLSSAISFDENKKIESDDVSFIPAYDNQKKLIGYIVYSETSGFASKIKFILGIDLSGKITGLKIIDASKETPGLGTKIANKNWEELWKGRDSEYRFDKKVDALGGATITPKSVYLGIKKILSSYDSIKPNTNDSVITDVAQNSSTKVTFGKDKTILSQVQKIFPEAVAYDSTIQKINGVEYILAYDVSDKKLGYYTKLKAEGVGDTLTFELGIDLSGKIIKLTNVNIGNNVPDYNELVLSSKWQTSWEGRDSTYKFNDSIDSESGASVSPKVIFDSTKKALNSIKSLKNQEPVKIVDSAIKPTLEKTSIVLEKDKKTLLKIKDIFPKAVAYDSNIQKIGNISYILTYDSSNNKLGYFTELKAEGVEDNITFNLGIDLNGKIIKLNNVNVGNNLPDYNTLVTSKNWQSSWTGRDKSYKFKDDIDSESGASVSPRAIYEMTRKALKNFEKVKGGN